VTSAAASAVRVTRGNHEAEDSGEEEQDDLNDGKGNKQLNKTGSHVRVPSLSLSPADVHQAPPKRVVLATAVEVVSQQTSGGKVEDEDDKVEEGGNKLHGVAHKENSEDGEGGEDDGKNGCNLREDDFGKNAEVSISVLMDHPRTDSHEDNGEEPLEKSSSPYEGLARSGCERHVVCWLAVC
jgi:hypothetical protein